MNQAGKSTSACLEGIEDRGVGQCPAAVKVVTGMKANLPLNTGGHPQRERNARKQWMSSTRTDNTKDFKSLANTSPQ